MTEREGSIEGGITPPPLQMDEIERRASESQDLKLKSLGSSKMLGRSGGTVRLLRTKTFVGKQTAQSSEIDSEQAARAEHQTAVERSNKIEELLEKGRQMMRPEIKLVWLVVCDCCSCDICVCLPFLLSVCVCVPDHLGCMAGFRHPQVALEL